METMTKRITTATATQWARIDELRQSWIDRQTEEVGHDETRRVVD